MKPAVSVITIGVDDLQQSVHFYRDGLGFPTEGIVGEEFEHGAVAFFDLQAGLKLAVWKRESIAHEAGITAGQPNPAEFTLGHNVNSKAEVDAIMEKAERAGAFITDPAHEAFWGGYSGHFQDPDGHLWEIVWNPGWMETD
ncbi:VOC family protein [Marinococcus sp. PL1-022]|uniref:VOC family protein n=1 Tax=Marinococcus sp. PL1-022 TaxID=3095363 RepID=UPI0029C57058|nr:VOC family protein [Marinococcus sp. PL1-022]MDX6153149.1 VOC family protein [Marinococcus sp. PL1-022]